MTGGGPPPPSPPAEDRELIDAIPNEFTVDVNVYDGDSIYAKQTKDSPKTQDSNESQPPAMSTGTSQTIIPPPSVGPRANFNKKRKKNNSDCCRESHEHQLFVLAKTAREEAMLLEKEAHECKMKNERKSHERRMLIMSLEEDYWKAKIMKLK